MQDEPKEGLLKLMWGVVVTIVAMVMIGYCIAAAEGTATLLEWLKACLVAGILVGAGIGTDFIKIRWALFTLVALILSGCTPLLVTWDTPSKPLSITSWLEGLALFFLAFGNFWRAAVSSVNRR